VQGRPRAAGEQGNLDEQVTRAGVGRVGSEKAVQASAVVTIPARDQLRVLMQCRRADRGVVAPLAAGERGGIDVVDAPADEGAETHFVHGAGA
jgi:hypothetical protein